MTEERDFAGFVLSFAAGTYLVTGSLSSDYTSLYLISSLSAAVTSFLLLALMNPSFRHNHAKHLGFTVMLTGFCCGIFMGGSSAIAGISAGESGLLSVFTGLGHRLGSLIDDVGFSNPDTNAIIKALITGERNEIPAHITEAFRDSGASHILALSGFHLGIIYSIISGLTSWMGGHKKVIFLKSFAITALCGAYTAATGAGPSISRAFIFILLGETAHLTHRKSSTSSILLTALLLQLVINPKSIHTVSFQLSYAAMAGIAYIYPRMKGFWVDDDRQQWPILRKIWTSASMSISCQLTTGPLAYHYFGTFPKYFLLTNLIVMPLTALIIPAALMTLALNALDICPHFVVQMTESMVKALTISLEIISDM